MSTHKIAPLRSSIIYMEDDSSQVRCPSFDPLEEHAMPLPTPFAHASNLVSNLDVMLVCRGRTACQE